MEQLTAEAVHQQIEAAALIADQETRVIEAFEVGKAVRQGDIYLHRVAPEHARGKVRTGEGARQLAVGEFRNARHIAEPPAVVYEGVALPKWCARGTFLGPLVESAERFTVSHPEHAAISCPPGTYQTTHQLDSRTLARVRD